MKLIVNSERSLLEAQGKLKREFEKNKYLSLSISSKKRSLDANALSHVWYNELFKQGDMTALEYKSQNKYDFGMAILAETDPEYVAIIKKSFRALTHEERLKAITHIDVTSLFNREQMKVYMGQIKIHWQCQGFVLSDSDGF